MKVEEKDVRVDSYTPAVPSAVTSYKFVHVPTGTVYETKGNSFIVARNKALVELQRMIDANHSEG